ncbi:MAG: hypothetical protein LBB45_00490 [Methanobrevibacter sp.]|nr:hypothetical protein [Candidatus Methanovirga basalitermitum]
MENKSYFCLNDFIKLNRLKNDKVYSNDLYKLLKRLNVDEFKYGIGIPNKNEYLNSSISNISYVDFIIAVDNDGVCKKYLKKDFY